jgi:quinol monooxygenase YgiN
VIVVLTEMSYAPESDAAMRAVVPHVERYCRRFDGCERFLLSFPANRSGMLLATEVWRDEQTLRAHLAVAHHASELATWHALVKDMNPLFFSASPLDLSAFLHGEARP